MIKSKFVRLQCNTQRRVQLMDTVQVTRSIDRVPGDGCPIATTEKDYRYLSITAKHNTDDIASQLTCDVYAVTGRRVSKVFISKGLMRESCFKENLLFSYRSLLRTGEFV